MNKSAYKFFIILALFFVSILILYLYVAQIQSANAYLGYLKIRFDVLYILWASVFFLSVVFFIPYKLKQPSDFFLFFHIVLVLIPYIILHPAGSHSTDWSLVWVIFVLILPLLVLFGMRSINIKIPQIRKYIPEDYGYFVVVFFSGLVIFLAFMNAPSSSGFDMATSYVRRIEGRETYPAGSFYAYANSIVMNGLSPLVAFWSGLKKSLKSFLIPLFIWLSFYYLIGVKAPLFMAIVSFFLGFFCTSKNINKLFLFFVYGILLLCVMSLLEYSISGYSYIGDYFIRRAFTVPPFLISIYSEFLNSNASNGWSFFNGFSGEKPISFVIGEEYMGMEGLNANSNTFISSFTSGGIYLYGLVCFIVVSFFVFLDAVYRGNKNPNIMFCGFIYSFLLIEQNATTALISSGVFFVLLITLFTSNKNIISKHKSC